MAKSLLLGGIFTLLIISGICLFYGKKSYASRELYQVRMVEDITALFNQSPDNIKGLLAGYMQDAKKGLDAIIAIPDDQRTFVNTAQAIDEIVGISNFSIFSGVLAVLEMVSPDEAMRVVCHEQVLIAKSFVIDNITNNVALYRAYRAYADRNGKEAELTELQHYFLNHWFSMENTMVPFKLTGLDLPEEQREQAKKINKEIQELTSTFEKNINDDKSFITVPADALAGLGDDFIKNLKQDGNGLYILGVDYPTYFYTLKHCIVESTRKNLMEAFYNRAYPANDAVLKKLIAKRDEYAQTMGFASYAELDLANQMVQTPDRADRFLNDLVKKAQLKADREFEMLSKELPDGVMLTADGKFKAWDLGYVREQYKKKKFDLDEREVMKYFPMEKTIKGLLSIYEQFLSLKLQEVPVAGLWHEDVKLIEAYDVKTNELLGYLLLDLYPRPNKFGHACEVDIIQSIIMPDGSKPPMLAIVIANFPKSTSTKPSLLKHSDVVTFFHEFGHAMHALFGRLPIIALSGTRTKQDFVELPSQMLEEWVWNEAMLKKISSHYQTGEPMSDKMIDTIVVLKKFASGDDVTGQAWMGLLALDYFGKGSDKNPVEIMRASFMRVKKHIQFSEHSHFYASFGHLTGYGAKYYGYLWSRVFAQDMFEYIKQRGLLDPVVGQRYITEVIGKGGGEDPNILLKNFLGREPNQEAFLKDMGL